MTEYSDYVIYVDESGDHNLEKVNSKYPVFVLVFCIFHKDDYVAKVTPSMQKLKFEYFGHDLVIFHEREIRKNEDPFKFLVNTEVRESFMKRLNQIVDESDMNIVASVINKIKLNSQYADPDNPYKLSLLFCLERAYWFLKDKNQHNKTTHIIVESRGQKEDNQLELEFRRICQKQNAMKVDLPFEIVFASKQCNSAGLQLADLIARPIGYNELKPEQTNRAFAVIQPKFRSSVSGGVEGYGLKKFP